MKPVALVTVSKHENRRILSSSLSYQWIRIFDFCFVAEEIFYSIWDHDVNELSTKQPCSCQRHELFDWNRCQLTFPAAFLFEWFFFGFLWIINQKKYNRRSFLIITGKKTFFYFAVYSYMSNHSQDLRYLIFPPQGWKKNREEPWILFIISNQKCHLSQNTSTTC